MFPCLMFIISRTQFVRLLFKTGDLIEKITVELNA